MKAGNPFNEPARVLMHLDGGYTRIYLERFDGVGMANGRIEWDIPTDDIPHYLRALGSRILVQGDFFQPEASDSSDELRAACQSLCNVVDPDSPAAPAI